MSLRFTKMHGLGNDFMVIDAIQQSPDLPPARVRALADRHFGVGFDQLLLVERPVSPDVDFRYRIFNSDGGEVEQCGNGARCFARFVRDRGLTTKDEIVVETNTGVISLSVVDDHNVRVNMGVPRLRPQDLPFTAEAQAKRYSIDVGGEQLEIGAVSMGNPHAVMVVADVRTAPVERLGPLLEAHGWFPRKVNAGFMEVVSREHIRLRVFERGVGETLACGTGACAAVVVGRLWGLLDEQVRVELPGGGLMIRWQGEGQPVWMTGPATQVYEGEIAL